MNWADHNLFRHEDVVSVVAWQKYEWLRQGFSLRSAGNISPNFGDVTTARTQICKALGFAPDRWTTMQQVHGNRVQVVESGSDFAETDAMISDKKDVLLAVVVADCVPLLFVDPVKKIVAVAHAGRRGTQAGIAETTFKQLLKRGSRAQDIQVAIGPSIGPCCYVFDGEPLDLWSLNEQQVREVGAQTIIRTNLCTKHTDYFFSHQADPEAGRFAGLIGII